jgi:diguanylate cyclase (GGDEF)-like protein
VLVVLGIGAAVGVGLNQFAAIQRALWTTALRDSLTGLWNRRALEDRLVHFSAVAQRTEAPFSLAILDLDHFKDVNDTYGHEAGDAALCHFARLLETSMRETDEVFRYGGEEFVVAFPATPVDDAHSVIERLRQRLAHDPPPTGPIGFSAGVATGADLAAVHAADAALFAAKRAGRGRTCCPGCAA